MSGVFSMASHSTLQYLPELAGHEQTGCAHFCAITALIAFPIFAVAISSLLSSDARCADFPSPPFRSGFRFDRIETLVEGVAPLRRAPSLAHGPSPQRASE